VVLVLWWKRSSYTGTKTCERYKYTNKDVGERLLHAKANTCVEEDLNVRSIVLATQACAATAAGEATLTITLGLESHCWERIGIDHLPQQGWVASTGRFEIKRALSNKQNDTECEHFSLINTILHACPAHIYPDYSRVKCDKPKRWPSEAKSQAS